MKRPKLLTNLGAWLYKQAMNRAGESPVPVQSGALPWRLKRSRKAEILLVTGRRSGRWIIPKGWPMAGKSLAESAEQEAFEEAGIKGRIGGAAIGSFRHVKQHLIFGGIEVDIHVHALAVEKVLADWPERGERQRRWFTLDEAAANVHSPQLRELIIRLGKQLSPTK
jgi:8-oxo-dGTP pyrophosphatase MutT (NUDIX family)